MGLGTRNGGDNRDGCVFVIVFNRSFDISNSFSKCSQPDGG